MKEPPPGYMSDIQGRINVFTTNLHPLILLLGIIKGSSDRVYWKVLFVRLSSAHVFCVCSAHSAYVQWVDYKLFVCGWVGEVGMMMKGVITVDRSDKLVWLALTDLCVCVCVWLCTCRVRL